MLVDGAGAAGPDRRGDGDARRAVCGVVQAGPKTERKKKNGHWPVHTALVTSPNPPGKDESEIAPRTVSNENVAT